MRFLQFSCIALPALLAAHELGAQQRPKPTTSDPCCTVTAIDARTGMVTAKEISTGHTFQFKVEDRALLSGLKVGGKLYADFAAGKVGVDPVEPCCSILGSTKPVADVRPDPVEPCCNIVAINASTGAVTAKVTATGQLFQFRLNDRAVLGSLKAGQPIWADFATKNVWIKPAEPSGVVTQMPAKP